MKSIHTCPLCDSGFPLVGDNHIGTQSLGMIPTMRCRKAIKRGDIRRFTIFLNAEYASSTKHRNGRFHQVKRPYGDYLYNQDRDRFMELLCEWLVEYADQNDYSI